MSISLGVLSLTFFSHDHAHYPPYTGYVHLPNTFFRIVTVTTTDTGWVNLGIPLLSKK